MEASLKEISLNLNLSVRNKIHKGFFSFAFDSASTAFELDHTVLLLGSFTC